MSVALPMQPIETKLGRAVAADPKLVNASLLVHSERLGLHWAAAHGQTDGQPTDPEQPFHTASIGKTFTAVLIAPHRSPLEQYLGPPGLLRGESRRQDLPSEGAGRARARLDRGGDRRVEQAAPAPPLRAGQGLPLHQHELQPLGPDHRARHRKALPRGSSRADLRCPEPSRVGREDSSPERGRSRLELRRRVLNVSENYPLGGANQLAARDLGAWEALWAWSTPGGPGGAPGRRSGDDARLRLGFPARPLASPDQPFDRLSLLSRHARPGMRTARQEFPPGRCVASLPGQRGEVEFDLVVAPVLGEVGDQVQKVHR